MARLLLNPFGQWCKLQVATVKMTNQIFVHLILSSPPSNPAPTSSYTRLGPRVHSRPRTDGRAQSGGGGYPVNRLGTGQVQGSLRTWYYGIDIRVQNLTRARVHTPFALNFWFPFPNQAYSAECHVLTMSHSHPQSEKLGEPEMMEAIPVVSVDSCYAVTEVAIGGSSPQDLPAHYLRSPRFLYTYLVSRAPETQAAMF